MKRTPLFHSALVALSLAVASTACRDSTPEGAAASQKGSSTKTDPFQRAVQSGELVAIAGGGAYLVATSGLYYVSGDKAALVSGLPAKLRLAEVHALADGTALLHIQISESPMLYLLKGTVATAITETRENLSAPTVTNLREGHLFAMNQQLRAALKSSTEQQVTSEHDTEYPAAAERY